MQASAAHIRQTARNGRSSFLHATDCEHSRALASEIGDYIAIAR
ncbi:hypothetical protein [Aquimonas sp.]|jgi:hypothetical protein